ncbi:MAG TPA: APC family permease, partial [Micromonosporaceae bacterium]|nr:APC family permease [Micromonosporaceae bacterium]
VEPDQHMTTRIAMGIKPRGLDRGSVGTWGMSFFTVSASAPMTVLAGSVVATYAVTGSRGVPLSFVVLAVALWPFTVGYAAMGRHVSHAGVFYAYIARGLSRTAGVAGGALALLAYNSIQICLYGLLGVSLEGFLPDVDLRWWGWALLAWILIAILGLLHIQLNAKVLAVTLGLELLVIALFDLAALNHPASGHLQLTGLSPSSLFTGGIGGVFAFGIAAFVGYETGPAYSEEANGTRPVSRATFTALTFLAVVYALSSLSLSVTEGPATVVDAARDPSSGIPFSIIARYYGSPLAHLANLLLITSIFGAMLSFHNTSARYAFALAREHVLPRALAATGSRGRTASSPVAGSILQSGLAVVVFGLFAFAGADPLATLFTWLSTVAALAIVALMAGTSMAVIGYFRRNPIDARSEPRWRTIGAPLLGIATLTAVLVITVANLDSVLGSSSNILKVAVPGVVVLAAVIGALWGAVLRANNPTAYRLIGTGERQPLRDPTPAFQGTKL